VQEIIDIDHRPSTMLSAEKGLFLPVTRALLVPKTNDATDDIYGVLDVVLNRFLPPGVRFIGGEKKTGWACE
jgi:hypothetical protein